MKRISAALLSIICLSPAAFADVSFKLNGGTCADIAGNWNGKGVADAWIVKCEYQGTGEVTGSSQLNIDMKLHYTGGSPLCPKENNMVLTGTCNNGHVSIQSDNMDLSGDLETRDKAKLSGKVEFSGIKADIDVTLTRQ